MKTTGWSGVGDYMFEQLVAMLKEVEQQDELFELVARCYKKTFDSLTKAGFSDEEAIRIVAGQGSAVKSS